MSEDGIDDVVLRLPENANAAAIARQFVVEHRDHLSPDVVEDAKLLVSELVSNAVRHGRAAITLRVRVASPGIGIAVHDDGAEIPTRPTQLPSTSAPHGRGLLIVDAMATAWGVVPADPPPGKTIWFELRPDEVPAES